MWNTLYRHAAWMGLTGVVALCAPTFSAQAAPFSNGSFESPGCGTSCRLQIPNSTPAPTGWQTTADGFQLYQATRTDNIEAQDGQYYVSFGHSGMTGGVLYQTFDTEAGATYEVEYYVNQQQGASLDQVVGVWVYDKAELKQADFIQGTTTQFGNSANVWVAGNKVEFVARSGQSTLVFQDNTPTGGGAGANWALDHVRVTKTKSPTTPTPPALDPTIARFVGQTTGSPEKLTLTGRMDFSSTDYGKSVKVWVLLVLPNGSVLSKVGDGNQWHFFGNVFALPPDLPSLPTSITASSNTLTLPILSDAFLNKGVGARVFIGYGVDFLDMLGKGHFGEIHNTAW